MYRINLQLFADGTEGAPGAGEIGADAEHQNGRETVVYGLQDDGHDAGAVENPGGDPKDTQTDPVNKPDKKKAFEDLIKGEYKEEFHNRVQSVIDKRLANSREMQNRMDSMQPIMDMIAQKYGIDPNDVDSVRKALEEDDSYYEDEAERKGLSVKQLKEIKKLERENEELKRTQAEISRRENADKIYGQWMQQAEALKQIYPSFSFENEIQDNQFVSLLKNGIDVRTAFEVIHKDEIIGGAMQYAAQTVSQKISNNIQSRAKRPAENGTSSQAGVTFKPNVNDWSKKDREEVERRVLRGEKIRL